MMQFTDIAKYFVRIAAIALLSSACVAIAPQVGEVIDSAGKPVANAKVSLAGSDSTATSDANGKFYLRVEGDAPWVVRVNAEGYARTVVRVTDANTAQIHIQVQPVESVTNLVLPGAGDAPVQAVLTRDDSTVTLTIPPNSMVTPSGAVASGNVTVYMTYWDGLRGMNTVPGPLLAKAEGGGEPVGIKSVGMADIEVRQGNDVLQVVPGMYLGWDVKAPDAIKNVMTVPQVHDNVHLFWLNPDTALWESVADIDSPTFKYDAQTGTLSGKLPHLSGWNYDMLGDTVGCVQGRVLDCKGNPIPNTPFSGWLMNVEGLYHAHWQTDSSGKYCENVQVPTNDYASNGQWTFPIHLSGPDSPRNSNMNPDVIPQACADCTEAGEGQYPGQCYCGKYNTFGDRYCPAEYSECAWVGQQFPAAYAQESYNYDGVRADKIVTITAGVSCPSTQCVQLPDLVIGTCSGGPPVSGDLCAGPKAKGIGDACTDSAECCGPNGTHLTCADGLCVPNADR